ncbi:MAG: insulinase family protein [Myxococcota bacterium]
MGIEKQKKMPLARWLFATILLVSGCSSLTGLSKQDAAKPVPMDRRIHDSRLDNGMRVAWMSNSYPKDRCYVRLVVDVGSLHEQQGQEGMAHFLEHLAFRGSKSYSEKQLTDWFGQQGMEFGPDVNAYTGFEETVYMLDLPSCSKQKLQEALNMLRQFASHLTLSAAAVAKEKGIVDSEERMHDLPARRASDKWFNYLLHGTRYATRHPIGKKQVRADFTAAAVRAFYRTWYTPNNSSIVIVGDLQQQDPQPLVQQAFGDWQSGAKQPATKPAVGDARVPEGFQAVNEKQLTHVSVQVSQLRLQESKKKATTVGNWLQNLPLRVAFAMLNQRLRVLQDEGKAEFLAAGFARASYFKLLRGVDYSLSSQPDKWQQALCQVESVLASALQHGFAKQELQLVVKNMRNTLQQAVTERDTTHSAAHVARAHKVLTNHTPPVDPLDRQRLMNPMLRRLTPKACQQALQQAWQQGQRFVQAMAGQDVGTDLQQQLQQAFAQCRQQPAAAWQLRQVGSFAYHTPRLQPQQVNNMVRSEHLEDVDVHRITFKNGVVLHVKQTDWQKDEVLLLLRLGAPGRLDLTQLQQIATTDVWQATFLESGLGKHSIVQLNKFLAGKTVNGATFVGERSLGLRGATRPQDFLFALELMRAYLLDPGFEQQGMVTFHQWLDAYQQQGKKSLSWPLIRQLIPALYKYDKRFCSIATDKIKQIEQPQVRHWFHQLNVCHLPLDIVVVGDMPLQAVVRQVAQTFGTLEPRASRSQLPSIKPIAIERGLVCQCLHEQAVESDVLLQLIYPIRRHVSLVQELQWELLERMLQTQLWEAVRGKLGATYNISVHAAPRVADGDGILAISTQVAPKMVAKVQRVIQQLLQQFTQQKPTYEQFVQASKPLQQQLQEAARTNSYWLHQINRCITRPERLLPVDKLKKLIDQPQQAATHIIDDIWHLAKQTLHATNASVFKVYPKRVETAPSAEGCLCRVGNKKPTTPNKSACDFSVQQQ